MATSRPGSNNTTRALRLRPALFRTVVPWVPATTWALVSTMLGATGKPLPKTIPPQPNPWIFRVSAWAACTPGVLIELGNGCGDGATGSSPEKADGKLTPAMMVCTLARKPGGRGAMASRVRKMVDRWMAVEICGLGTRARLRPRNQDTERTAMAEKAAPPRLSIRPVCGRASSRRRIGSPTQYPALLPDVPRTTRIMTAPREPSVERKRETGPNSGSENTLGLGHLHRRPAAEEGDAERSRH